MTHASESDRKSILPYAIAAFVAFLCGAAILMLMLRHAERLTALGLTGNLYYITLLPLALCAAAFLFGVLHSYASYRGRHLGGLLELGGPIIASALVVIGGFVLPPAAGTFAVTVYVHGKRGVDNLVLRNAGAVVMDLGAMREHEPIQNDGQAYFPAIPASYRGQAVHIWVDSKEYRILDSDALQKLNGQSLYLTIQARDAAFSGHVRSRDGQPIPRAEIDIANFAARADANGFFEMTIPGDRLRAPVELDVKAPGYAQRSYIVTPNANPIDISLEKH